TSTGLPVDSNGDRVGGPFVWLTAPALLGGVAVIGYALAHSATFLALKADGPVRERCAQFAARWAPLCLLPAALWALLVQTQSGGTLLSWSLVVVAVAAALFGWVQARRRNEGLAFIGYAGFGVSGVAAIFAGMFQIGRASCRESVEVGEGGRV